MNNPYAVAVIAATVSDVPIWTYNLSPVLKPAHKYKTENPLKARKIHMGSELNISAT